MVRNRQPPSFPSEPTSSDPMGYAAEVLERLVDLLITQGHSPSELARRFSQICKTKKAPERALEPITAEYITQLGQILAHWYDDPAYIDESGAPLRLPFRSRHPSGPSFANLIERLMPGQDPAEILELLLQSSTVRQVESMLEPVRRFTSLSESFALTCLQNLLSILGLLRTLQHNLSCKGPAQRLVERKAGNLCIPLREEPAVQTAITRESNAFLERIDSLLMSKSVPAGSEPTVAINVVVFSYEEVAPLENDKAGRPKR